MNFATLKGLTIPEGVVKQITDASGRVLWNAPKPVTITVTTNYSSGSPALAYITYNGIRYETSATIDAFVGDTIICTADGSMGGCVRVNGTPVVTEFGAVTYEYVLTGNIAIELKRDGGSAFGNGYVNITEL